MFDLFQYDILTLSLGKSHVCFHIDTILGRKSEDSPLPSPDAFQDKGTCDYEKDLESVQINLSELPTPFDNQSTVDPCFPYGDGPGHQKSNPQQLAVMWKLMNSVGLQSFCPDFSDSAQSFENKWLWEIAEKIFIVLVECGEYSGVSLCIQNREYIRSCFDSHFQTLKKRFVQIVLQSYIYTLDTVTNYNITSLSFLRYRTEQWAKERRQAATDANRRQTRLGRVRFLYSCTSLSINQPELNPQ